MISNEELDDLWGSTCDDSNYDLEKASQDLFKFVSWSDEDIFDDEIHSNVIETNEDLSLLHSFLYRTLYKNTAKTNKVLNSKISALMFEEGELSHNKNEKSEETKDYRWLSPDNDLLMHRRTRSQTTNSLKSFSWNKNNIYKCYCLLELVRVENLNKEILNVLIELDIVNVESLKKYVSNTTKKLRELYIITLSLTSPDHIEVNDKIPQLSKFLNLSGREISKCLSSIIERTLVEDIRRLSVEDNEDKHSTLSLWLNNHQRLSVTRTNHNIKKLISEIHKELDLKTIDEELDEDLTESIHFLEDAVFLAFISGQLPEGQLKVELYKIGMTIRDTTTFINDERLKLKEEMFYHIGKVISFLEIDISKFNRLVSNALNINTGECLVSVEYAVSLMQTIHQTHQREIVLNKAYKSAKNLWDSKILTSLSNYHLWGIWFRIIFTIDGLKYLEVKPKDTNLIRRLNRHYSQFKGLFVRERSWVKYLFKGKKIPQSPINAKDIKGISVWKYCHTSTTVKVDRCHEIYERRQLKFDRKGLAEYEFDFSSTPEEIQLISPQFRDYIQLGILYSYTDYIGGLKTLTLTRDFQKNLNNLRVKFLKFNRKVLPLNFRQERKITNAIAWLKSNNHLSLSYPTIYECEEIKGALNKIDPKLQPSDDDYILIQPINADKEFRDQQIIEVLGREFVFTNKIPESIRKQREQFSDLNNSYKSIVFYRDPYVEEKLFVHLFPKGVGGYNSTFYKYMPLNQYIKMRLLSGYTDAFRNDKRYILFFYDWIRKKRIHESNNCVKIHRLKDINREFIRDLYDEDEVDSEFNYYDKLGSRLFKDIKHCDAYKRERFYEVQTLIQNFGKPDLFLTVRFHHKDAEAEKYIRSAFNLTPITYITYQSHPVEYAVFYKKKVGYVRKFFDPKNKEDSIFGKVIAYCDTLEYTKTGIPHLHSLIWLCEEDKSHACVDHNDTVFAAIRNPRNIVDDELNRLIEKHQIHRCVKWKWNVTKDQKHSDKCLKGYPFKECVKDYQEYAQSQIYYKRTVEDKYVVPYNPEFLKLMKTSTNLQIVSSENIAVYMSKYITITQKPLFKNDKVNNQPDMNKVEVFLKERKIGIIEASMELLNCRSYAVRPSVVNFRLTLPNERFL